MEDRVDHFNSFRFKDMVVDEAGIVHDDVNFEIGCITPGKDIRRSLQGFCANICGSTAISITRCQF